MFLLVTISGVLLYLKGFKYHGLLCFIFLLTDGLQIVPPPVMLFDLHLFGKDYALIFSLTILLSYLITRKIKFPFKNLVFLAITIFLIYLAVAAFVDLTWFNPSVLGFALIFRVNLFLLTYFWMSHIEPELWKRLFRFILVVTIIQSVLCLLQIPSGLKLLTQGGITQFDELGFRWFRYTNLPYFLFPCLFIVLSNKKLKIPYKSYVIILFFLVIFLTLTRTLILGLAITIAISVLLGLFKKQKKIVFGFLMVFILVLPLIGKRLLSSKEDLNSVTAETELKEGTELTFTYRIFHMTERLLFISQTNKGKFFGIGFIHEKDFSANTFLLGHKNDEGDIVQLEQADISWSNLFLRFGIYGTILYLFIYITFFRFFLKHKSNSIAAAAIMFMIISIILSISSAAFSQADFYLIPFSFFFYIKKELLQPLNKNILINE